MKNYLTSTYLFLLVIACFFTSCQKDLDQTIPIGNENYITSIFGVVHDEDGIPISSAEITFRNVSTLTDEYGTYIFQNVVVDSRYNAITIEKEGFFQNTRTFRGTESEFLVLKSKLAELNFEFTMESNTPKTITNGPISIDFDGGGMVIKESGNVYQGSVKVALHYLHPLDQDLGDIMPGDLSGVNENNQFRLLESFGMVGVELQSEDGRPLQLAENSKAILTANIPQSLLSEAPNEIPLWHFDHDLGLWVEEGMAIKEGNSYKGTVSHFSFWNFDLQRPSVMISGRLVDANGIGIGATQVKIMRPNALRGGSGYTDYDGYFNGPIEKSTPLELTIISRCNGEKVVYSQQIGPFEEETNLGDIILDIPGIEYLSISANFQDCEGNVMEEGLLKINDLDRPEYFPILGGSIDKTFGICGLDAIELEVIDRKELQITSLGVFDVPGMANLDNIKVCDKQADFASISSSTYDIDLVLVDSVGYIPIGISKSLTAFDFSFDIGIIEIKYLDNDSQGIEKGTFDILKMVFNYRPNENVEELVLILDEGTITVESVDEVEKIVSGSYIFDAEVDGPDVKHTFKGEFYAHY